MSGFIEHPIRGFCIECDGAAERLAYETLPDSGIGVCIRCCEYQNRVDREEDEAVGIGDEEFEQNFLEACEDGGLDPEAFNKEHRE